MPARRFRGGDRDDRRPLRGFDNVRPGFLHADGEPRRRGGLCVPFRLSSRLHRVHRRKGDDQGRVAYQFARASGEISHTDKAPASPSARDRGAQSPLSGAGAREARGQRLGDVALSRHRRFRRHHKDREGYASGGIRDSERPRVPGMQQPDLSRAGDGDRPDHDQGRRDGGNGRGDQHRHILLPSLRRQGRQPRERGRGGRGGRPGEAGSRSGKRSRKRECSSPSS